MADPSLSPVHGSLAPVRSSTGPVPRRWPIYLATTVGLAVGGTLLFGLIHALLIEPIWRRLLGGLPFALLAAAGMTWCHAELVARRILPQGIGGGVLFGGSLWLALLPMTAVAAVIRVSGARASLGSMEPVVEIAVAALTGAAIGYLVSRSWRATLACAVCITGVVLAMAGPIAVTVGATQRRLLLAFLPLWVAAGVALSLVQRFARAHR